MDNEIEKNLRNESVQILQVEKDGSTYHILVGLLLLLLFLLLLLLLLLGWGTTSSGGSGSSSGGGGSSSTTLEDQVINNRGVGEHSGEEGRVERLHSHVGCGEDLSDLLILFFSQIQLINIQHCCINYEIILHKIKG